MEIQMKNLIGDNILSLELVARQHHWEGFSVCSIILDRGELPSLEVALEDSRVTQ